MTKFQIILTSIFVVFIIVGVVMFATYKSNNANNALPTITVWGTFPEDKFNNFVQQLNLTRETAISINYVEIPTVNFRKQFIEELARGKGPDAILIPQQEILGFNDKIVEIPNTVLTQRDFQNTYIPQANLYLTQTGTLAIPMIIDPLIMYWNRTIYTNAGIAKHPTFWDEFASVNSKITTKDQNSNIRKSAIALGEFNNIDHAREILSALLIQSGNPITGYSDGAIKSYLGDSRTSPSALLFYTQYSDPRNSQYSWNRSLPSAKSSFLSGNLATYFGFTSEIAELRQKNPNIDYDVAALPQIRNTTNRSTYGNMYGLSMVKSAVNQSATYQIMNIITAPDAVKILSQLTYLPSVRRDDISAGSTDPYMSIFLDSALISKGWLDTSPIRTNVIFTNLVESITSGRSDVNSALKQADDNLNLSLQIQ